jgi:hypothetical protein
MSSIVNMSSRYKITMEMNDEVKIHAARVIFAT